MEKNLLGENVPIGTKVYCIRNGYSNYDNKNEPYFRGKSYIVGYNWGASDKTFGFKGFTNTINKCDFSYSPVELNYEIY